MSIKRIKVEAWQCKCERCPHEWVTLTDQLPKVCPKCEALTWNKPIWSRNRHAIGPTQGGTGEFGGEFGGVG